MPLIGTRGAASAQGFGEFAQQTAATYIEDVFSTYVYTGNGSTQGVNNGIALGNGVSSSLQGLPITVVSGNFSAPYVIDYINDGLAPSNNSNFSYSNTTFDIYVTFPTAVTLTAYNLAPQGGVNTPYNTPTGFVVLASNDALSWTTIATFTSISTGSPNWDPGVYRTFSFSNTTAYKYWRLQCTGSGSGGAGNSLTEWRVTGTTSAVGKGGLVWIKSRSGAYNHNLMDTTRGMNYLVESNTLAAQQGPNNYTTATSNGFFIENSFNGFNASGQTYTSWTFRKQPKFFDVVTYTGTGSSAQTVSHNLGSVPGAIIIKRTDATSNWYGYFRTDATYGQQGLSLNVTSPALGAVFTTDVCTSTTFKPVQVQDYGGNAANTNGATFVAYIFAHNAGGFGLTGADNVISCGSFTTDGSGNATVSLGYEPQWILVKRSASTGSWAILDNIRQFSYSNGAFLYPNLSNAEFNGASTFVPTATGFNVVGNTPAPDTFIYIAIRRGPMQTPTSGTSVFTPIARSGTGSDATVSAGFPADMVLTRKRNNTQSMGLLDRMRGNTITLFTDFTGAQGSNTGSISFDTNAGFNVGSDVAGAICNEAGFAYIQETFRRAPGFMDVVCYTGNGASSRSVTHNLTVAPEMMIVKSRNLADTSWDVWHTANGVPSVMYLNNTNAKSTISGHFDTLPTASVFYVGGSAFVNESGYNYVAYLFASCPGVSKVGSYTGTGATQTISCGFAARFVLIKRTDSTGSWWIWDTARGMVAGTDPRLALNNSTSETNTNWVYTDASGFQIVTTDATVNASGGSYIYLAIA